MKGDFEKNIESKLSDFKLEPSPQVWLDVEQALLQSRKRKIVGWWWIILPVLLFLVSGGIWWMNHKEISNSFKIVTVLNLKNRNTVGHKQNTDSSIAGSTGVNAVEKANRVKTNQEYTDKISIANNHKEKLASKNQAGDRQLFTEDHQGNRNNSGNAHDVSVAQIDKKNSRVNIITTPSNGNKTGFEQEVINNRSTTNKNVLDSNKQNYTSIVNQSTKENTPNVVQRKIGTPDTFEKNVLVKGKQKDSVLFTSNAGINNEHKQRRQNKHHWFITAAGGFMNAKEGTNLFSSNQNASSSALTTGANNGGSYVNRSIPQAGHGYSFGIGFLYSQSVNTRWAINVGLQYRYLQNKQSVGLDSLPINSALTYFSNSQSLGSKINYAHWIQLPVILQYTLNPTSKYQLALSAGGSIAWAFSEQWLITDKTNTSYPFHYNSSLDNRFIANLHAGIGLNCNNKFMLSLLAEQSLTPIHKNTTEKFYWQQFSLQISKPLHLSSHQNKKPKT